MGSGTIQSTTKQPVCNDYCFSGPNALILRDFWLEEWEKAAILTFRDLYPLEGYQRLAYMMLDADVVAVSPSSVYRVLKAAGKLAPRWGQPSKKGQGFSS